MLRRWISRRLDRLARAIADRIAPAAAPVAAPPAVTVVPPDQYLAGAALIERLRRGEAVRLADSELRVSSQNGEDGILAEILRRIGVPADPWFVEFGVESGSQGNCVWLADVRGWSGLFLEPAPASFARLSMKYSTRPEVRTVQARVTPENADDLFRRAGAPPDPDVLSIDVDSIDYWIWRGITGHRPRVVVVEYNSSLGAEERLTIPADHTAEWDGTNYFGASIAALTALGEAKGYRLVHTDLAGVNAFFVEERHLEHFADAPLIRGPNFLLGSHSHPADGSGRAYHRDPPT